MTAVAIIAAVALVWLAVDDLQLRRALLRERGLRQLADAQYADTSVGAQKALVAVGARLDAIVVEYVTRAIVPLEARIERIVKEAGR